MQHKDKRTLARFREATRCEYCKRALRHRAEPHHLRTRGSGGSDVSLNLLALGSYVDCNCHGLFHNGNLPRCNLIAALAQREGLVFSETEWSNAMALLVRAPKDADKCWFLKEVLDWTAGERLLVFRTLKEIGIA